MVFIIGGAYQGKTQYAMKMYNLKSDEILDGKKAILDEIINAKCIKNFHIFIKRLLELNGSPLETVKKILAENTDIIIIMDEIGSGIIPIEKSERIWREQTGIIGCFIAENSKCVERIACGIGVRIK